MNLRKIEYFVAVAEERSISLAAQKLHMTQPPLSQTIKALERELGVALLTRNPRGVELTQAGHLLFEQGRRLLGWSDRLSEEVRRLGSGEAGQLRIASVPTFAWSHLAPLLVELGEQAPGITVELTDPDPATVLQRATDGEADLGFVSTSNPDELAALAPHLEVRTLVTMPLVLATRAGAGSARSLPELMDEMWIIPAAVHGFPGLIEIAEELWRNSGRGAPPIQYVSTVQTALPLVAAGLGVGLLPADFIGAANGRIAEQQVPDPIPPLYGTLVRSAEIEPVPALRTVLQAVSRHFGLPVD